MKVKYAIVAFLLYYIEILFCVSNILVTSQVTSMILKVVSAGVAVLVVLAFLFNTRGLTHDEVRVFALPVMLLLAFLMTYLIYGENDLTNSSLQCFICYAIPMTVLAVLFNRKDLLDKTFQYADIINIAFCLYYAYIFSNGILAKVQVRDLQSMTNIGYQSTSYYGAYGFGLSLYALLFLRNRKKNHFFNALLTVYRVAVLIASLVIAIYGSGRGAIVLILVYTVVLFMLYSNNEKSILKILLFLAAGVLLVFLLSKVVAKNSALSNSFNHIYQLLGAREITYLTTSGRNVIYQKCWEAFLESPVIGHGLSSASFIGIGQPHQMFLEVMVEGGLVYLGIWLTILYGTFKRFFWLLKNDSGNFQGYVFICVVFLSQFVGIQFSGFYIQSVSMWFCLAFIRLRYSKLVRERHDIQKTINKRSEVIV